MENKKICDNCEFFRIKSDNYGICDNLENTTKVLSVNLIQHFTGCDEYTAREINESIRYHKNFGCILFKKQ